MNASWPIVALGDVLAHRKEFVVIDDLQNYRRPRVQLHAQGIVLRDEVPGALIKTKKQQVCRAGELLVAEIDAKVGGFGLVPPSLDGAIVSSHYFLFVADEVQLDRRFLEWFVKTPSFRDQVEAQGSTNYAAIRSADVLGYRMPLPPLAEQHRIVARIEEVAGKVDAARVLRQQAADEAKALTRSTAKRVFDEALVGCSQMRLADWVSVCGGGTPAKTNPTYWQGIIPWVSPKDMKQREIWESQDHISEHATAETPAKLIQPGAVLVVVRGMILAHTFPSAVLKVPAAINQDMKALIPRPGLLPDYLCAFLWGYNRRVLELVEKSTHDTRKLQTPHLLDIKIHSPTVDQQHRILARLRELERKTGLAKCLQVEAGAEFDSLLPAVLDRAFKGEL